MQSQEALAQEVFLASSKKIILGTFLSVDQKYFRAIHSELLLYFWQISCSRGVCCNYALGTTSNHKCLLINQDQKHISNFFPDPGRTCGQRWRCFYFAFLLHCVIKIKIWSMLCFPVKWGEKRCILILTLILTRPFARCVVMSKFHCIWLFVTVISQWLNFFTVHAKVQCTTHLRSKLS